MLKVRAEQTLPHLEAEQNESRGVAVRHETHGCALARLALHYTRLSYLCWCETTVRTSNFECECVQSRQQQVLSLLPR